MGKSRDRSNLVRKGSRRRPSPAREGLLPMTAEDLLRDKPRKTEPFEPRTEAQARYARSIEANTLTFGVGPAGTGKTFVAASIAAEKLAAGEVERIIITRPIVEADGEELGFLPGDMTEKTDPYMRPLLDVLSRKLGRSYTEALRKAGKIEVLPLAFMRGASLRGAMLILDEAQNTTPKQMKMFLTRTEEGVCIVVDGDLQQRDIPGISGLEDAIRKLRGKPGVGYIRFTKDDIVRSGFTQMIVEAYEHTDATDEESEDPYEGLQRALNV